MMWSTYATEQDVLEMRKTAEARAANTPEYQVCTKLTELISSIAQIMSNVPSRGYSQLHQEFQSLTSQAATLTNLFQNPVLMPLRENPRMQEVISNVMGMAQATLQKAQAALLESAPQQRSVG